jgi:predicted enzyme related to lactoylglutathione lyase
MGIEPLRGTARREARSALAAIESGGGEVLEPKHHVAPHGFRACILDTGG